MFTNSPNEIEASDIDAVQRTGDAIPLGDGRIALPVHLVLSPHTGKSYVGEDFPAAIHITNGVQARRLDIEDWRPALALTPGLAPTSDSDSVQEAPLQTAPATGDSNSGIELEADGEEHEATLVAEGGYAGAQALEPLTPPSDPASAEAKTQESGKEA